jgi:hypothetical protein
MSGWSAELLISVPTKVDEAIDAAIEAGENGGIDPMTLVTVFISRVWERANEIEDEYDCDNIDCDDDDIGPLTAVYADTGKPVD